MKLYEVKYRFADDTGSRLSNLVTYTKNDKLYDILNSEQYFNNDFTELNNWLSKFDYEDDDIAFYAEEPETGTLEEAIAKDFDIEVEELTLIRSVKRSVSEKIISI